MMGLNTQKLALYTLIVPFDEDRPGMGYSGYALDPSS